MEYRKLTAADYDALLEMLNFTFANKYGREMDFLCEQPKMWVRDDEHMGKHTGAFDGDKLVGVVGVYPLPAVICGRDVIFATTGNVATHPDYEGRGIFSKLFSMAMREAEEMGIDVCRLGGARKRYARYGFEAGGSCYELDLNEKNRIGFFDTRGGGICFKPICKEDKDALDFVDGLVRKKDFYVKREGRRDCYLALMTKHSSAYLALRDGVPIGYICAYADAQYVGASDYGRHISEFGAVSSGDAVDMFCAYQAKIGQTITFSLPPHEKDLIRILSNSSESISIGYPSRFRVLNYEKLADATMKLKNAKERLSEGEARIGIEGYGTLKLYCRGGDAGAVMTEEAAEMQLNAAEATRFLFGPLPPFAVADATPAMRDFLPLPLSWCTLDYV